jgi:hypothetical protein
MGQGEYFRVNRESICMDGGMAEGQASCCGVNLAFAGFEGFGVGGDLFSASWDAGPDEPSSPRAVEPRHDTRLLRAVRVPHVFRRSECGRPAIGVGFTSRCEACRWI